MDHQKTSMDPQAVSAPRVTTPVETMQKQRYADAAVLPPVLHANVSVATHTVNPEPKHAETSDANIAGKANVPPDAAFVSSTTPGGAIENKPEAN